MKFESACKAAYDYFEKEWEVCGLSFARETETKWIFRGGKPDVVIYGMPSVTVDKTTGELVPIVLPDKEAFKMLSKAGYVPLPDKYKA